MKSVYLSRCGAMVGMALLLTAGLAAAGEFDKRHVLVIGIDGCRPDALKAASTPAMDALIANGAVTYDAYAGGDPGTATQQATSSGPGWSSILTGTWTDRHGVTDNSFSGSNYANYPHFFVRLKEARPNAYLSSVTVWNPIYNAILHGNGTPEDFGLNVNDDAALEPAVVNHLGNADPDVLFVHFDDVDHAGHAHGYGISVPEYIASIESVDAHIAAIMAAIAGRANAANEEWLVIVTTDHGGIGQGHGGQSADEREIFMIVSGANPVRGEYDEVIGHQCVPATVCEFLGVPVDPAWGWETRHFGFGPYPQRNLAGEFVKRNGQVVLDWRPAVGLAVTEYELWRDGSLVATLPAEAAGYVDAPPVAPGDLSWSYTLKASAGADAAQCPDLVATVTGFTGDLRDGLVAYYDFDGNFNDGSDGANVNNASVLSGAPAFVAGKFGQCVSLDGVDDAVTLGSPGDLDFGTATDFSLSFWYRTGADQSSDPVVIGNKDWVSGTNAGWMVEANAYNGDDLALQIGDGSSRADGAARDVNFNQWHHVVAVYKRGRTMDLYLDGALTSSTDISGVTGSLTSALATNIGQDGTGNYPDFTLMDMDDLAVWRRELRPVEIAQIHSGGVALGETLVSVADTDGDGLPDAWEDAHGLDKNSAADAALDKDHDGQSNLAEYLASTDPTDAGDVLRILDLSLSGEVRLKWTSVAGKKYGVMRSMGDLDNWYLVRVHTGSAGETQLSFPRDGEAVFYRVMTW